MKLTTTYRWAGMVILTASIIGVAGTTAGCTPPEPPAAPAPQTGPDAPQMNTGGAQSVPTTPMRRD